MKFYKFSLIVFLFVSCLIAGVLGIMNLKAFAEESQSSIFDTTVSGFKVRTVLPRETKVQTTNNVSVNVVKKPVKTIKAVKAPEKINVVAKTQYNNSSVTSYSAPKRYNKARNNYNKAFSGSKKPISNNNVYKDNSVRNSSENYVQPSDPVQAAAPETEIDSQKVENINKLNETTVQSRQLEPATNKNEPSLLNLLSSLFFVIILIIGVGWFSLKLRNVNLSAVLSGKLGEKELNKFKILYTATIGQGKNIHIVEINGKQLVIGSTASNINLLTELKDEDMKKDKETIVSDVVKNADFDYSDPDAYANTYPELYKEYIKNNND